MTSLTVIRHRLYESKYRFKRSQHIAGHANANFKHDVEKDQQNGNVFTVGLPAVHINCAMSYYVVSTVLRTAELRNYFSSFQLHHFSPLLRSSV